MDAKIRTMITALVGSDELAEQWWNSPNKAFNMQCPKDTDYQTVFEYLVWHCFCAGG